MNKINQINTKQRRKLSVRRKLHGTSNRPRLCVFRSNKFIFLQLVDDNSGKSLATVSDSAKDKKYQGTKTERAEAVAKELAQIMKKKKIEEIIFDRGPYKYHGRVKASAEILRAEGINF